MNKNYRVHIWVSVNFHSRSVFRILPKLYFLFFSYRSSMQQTAGPIVKYVERFVEISKLGKRVVSINIFNDKFYTNFMKTCLN